VEVAHTMQIEAASKDAPAGKDFPNRQELTVTRILRDTKVGKWVKQLHNFTCQICGTRLVTPAGAYAETCHIKPLGRPHNGPDSPENTLCLCPNCHVLLDEFAVWINDDHSFRRAAGVSPRYREARDFLRISSISSPYVWQMSTEIDLDIFWLRDESLEESANMPDPDMLALEIAEELEAALEQFAAIAEALKR
jgi:HNH endonuclease